MGYRVDYCVGWRKFGCFEDVEAYGSDIGVQDTGLGVGRERHVEHIKICMSSRSG